MAREGFIKGNNKDNAHRRFAGGGPRPDRNEDKRAEARERDAAWSALSPEQQLANLDSRLGKGKGAKRQRARIAKVISAKSPVDLYQRTNHPTTPADKGHDRVAQR